MPVLQRRSSRLILLGVVYLGLIVGGQFLGVSTIEMLGWDARTGPDGAMHGASMAVVGVYALLMMMPFMPAIEVGVALMLMFGADICLQIYLATVGALCVTFMIGRLVPVRVCAAVFRFLGLRRARALVLALAPLDERGRLELLLEHAPRRVVPTLLRHRYLGLALVLNLPGNALLGGGGGIAMIAGMSGLFAPPLYLMVVALAVLPVPLAVALTGGAIFW
jgi:hypothetical protein